MAVSAPVFWIIVILVLAVLILALMRSKRHSLDRESIAQEARQAAREAAERAAREVAPDVVQGASEAAVRAYQQREETIREQEVAKRREAASRAKETKLRKIAELKAWRPTFVSFVRKLAEPFFAEWRLDAALLDEWAEERADVYIARKPYVLEIIQSVHADAQNAAEALANRAGKSTREIARERAKNSAKTVERNITCPYCGDVLDARAHLDHIIPVQRGGPSTAWNTVFACVACNRAKRDMSLLEFFDSDYARGRGLRGAEIAKRLRDAGKYVEVLQ